MKKYLYTIMMAMLPVLSWSLSSCGSDGDDDIDDNQSGSKSELVGTWDIEKTTTKYYTTVAEAADYYNREEVEDGDGAYWVFTSSTLTVYDDNDVADGAAVKYTYDKSSGELKIAGALTYKVKKLNSSSMTLFMDSSDGQFGISTTIEFAKRN